MANHGFVSMQSNPFADDDPERIANEAHEYRQLGVNVIAKIPVIRAGLEAIEQLVAEDGPIIATEVMTISHAVHACELYERVSAASAHHSS